MMSGESINKASGSNLRFELNALIENGVCDYDPVRFRYIESMLKKADNQRKKVGDIIELKAQQALSEYTADYSQAKDKAEKLVKTLSRQSPEWVPDLQRLFDANDFKGINRIARNIEKKAASKLQQCETLSNITRLLGEVKEVSDETSVGLAFDEFMRQQEEQMKLSLTTVVEEPPQAQADFVEDRVVELKAVRRFKQFRLKKYADDLVNQSIELSPENPGPLNPQMLAIRSLENMRDLSPHYLNRFVAYVDAMLWLEKFEDKSRPVKSKDKN